MKILLILLSLFSMVSASAADTKGDYLTVALSTHTTDIFHQETSGATSYFPLNKRSGLISYELILGAEKELFYDSLFSFSLNAFGGFEFGRKKKEYATDNLVFRDKAFGYLYGGGASINTNFRVKKLKVQPFVGMNILMRNVDYKLSYGPLTSSTSVASINIDYNNEATEMVARAGLRVFDEREKLFSIFAVENVFSASRKINLDAAKVNNGNIDLTTHATFDHASFRFTLGFGMMF